MQILAPSGRTLWRWPTWGGVNFYPDKPSSVLNISSRGVVTVMRDKVASGDPDMLDLKYFLMNEVVTAL